MSSALPGVPSMERFISTQLVNLIIYLFSEALFRFLRSVMLFSQHLRMSSIFALNLSRSVYLIIRYMIPSNYFSFAIWVYFMLLRLESKGRYDYSFRFLSLEPIFTLSSTLNLLSTVQRVDLSYFSIMLSNCLTDFVRLCAPAYAILLNQLKVILRVT